MKRLAVDSSSCCTVVHFLHALHITATTRKWQQPPAINSKPPGINGDPPRVNIKPPGSNSNPPGLNSNTSRINSYPQEWTASQQEVTATTSNYSRPSDSKKARIAFAKNNICSKIPIKQRRKTPKNTVRRQDYPCQRQAHSMWVRNFPQQIQDCITCCEILVHKKTYCRIPPPRSAFLAHTHPNTSSTRVATA